MNYENRQKNIVIVGCGEAGLILKKDIDEHYPEMTVVGFVDDSIVGDSVLGSISDFPSIQRTHKIDEIVVAVPSADGLLLRRVLLENLNNRVPIRVVPREQHVMRDLVVSYDDLRDIDPDDFLGRPISRKNMIRLEKFYADKVVLVTGGAGSIGSEIVSQLIYDGAKKVVIYDNSEFLCYQIDQLFRERGTSKRKYRVVIGSVTDQDKVNRVIKKLQPDAIFHVAAYKHVHLMEENIEEAIKTNVIGTRFVLDVAREVGVPKFVFVSTDKVVHPTSVMGASKCLAEAYVKSVASGKTKCSIVRFGNVINSHGSVLPLFDRQMKDHRYITITSIRMQRFFMSIREAAELVLLSGTRTVQGAVYVLDMGELVRLYDVARCFIRSNNLRPKVDVELKVIGKRQGEKMIEELFTENERKYMQETTLDNIWQFKSGDKDLLWDEGIEDLVDCVGEGSAHGLRSKLRLIFPSLAK